MSEKELVVSIPKAEYMEAVFQAGADAVCLRYRSFALQHGEDFFDVLESKLSYAHSASKKVYFAFDFFSHNEDIEMLKILLPKFDEKLTNNLDAIIVYDPGVFKLVRSFLPQMRIHISSTINVTNDSVCDIWKQLGAARIELAHVLSADAIEQIAMHCSMEAEIQAFVYGIPCISYSGRSLLSGFLEECNVPKEQTRYSVMEEQRPGEYYMVEQDERGTYVFDSKTRDWTSEITRLAQSGVVAFSIEGMAYNEQQLVDAICVCKKAIQAN